MKNNTLQRNNTLQNNSFPNNQLLCNWLERERNGYQGFTEAGIKKPGISRREQTRYRVESVDQP